MTAVFAALAESDSTESMLGMVARSASRLPGWDSAALLMGVQGHTLRGYFSRAGHTPAPLLLSQAECEELCSASDVGAQSNGRLRIIANAEGTVAHALGCRTLAAAHMLRGQRRIGLLVLGSVAGQPTRDATTSDRGEHLGAVVDQIALALEARHLHAELQTAYDDLRAAQESLVESAKLGAVGTLAASIAHDIRNILTPLKLELAMAGPESPLAAARAHVDRLSALAHRLLAISQPSERHHGSVDVKQMVEGIRPLVEHQAELEKIVIRSDWPDDLPPVRGDRSRLEHLFINLMLNGLNAMASRGGVLRLTATRESEFVRVDVSDDGVGIEEMHLQRIFEPFYTTRSNGSGLGLFSVRRIAEEHNGSVAVITTPGQGTCFSVRLPADTGEYQSCASEE
jgi:signal transduction histidine kinase